MQPLQKERQSLENAASKLLSLALKAGAQSAEVCATFGIKTKISLEKQDYHMASSDDGYQLGLRVLVGQKQGFSSGNSIDSKELKEIALRAVEIAGFSPENPYSAICPSANIPKEAPTDLWDDALYHLSLQTQKDWAKVMVDEALKDSRFRLNEGQLTISAGLYTVLNSHGTYKLERETDVSWSLMGMAVEGETITSFDYFQHFSRAAAGVPDKIWGSTKTFRNQMVQSLKQGPAKTYRGIVLFTPRAVVDIFLPTLSFHLSGRSVLEKVGRWGIGHLGQLTLSDQITLFDKPWLVDRMGCAVFDREGTPTRELALVQSGILRNFLCDQYAAKGLSLSSTGNAGGGPSASPSVSPHCLCLLGGEDSKMSWIRRISESQKDFLVVHRFSGQTDPVTGDFSGVAKGGEWWHAGERSHFVQETLISGNVYELMGKDLLGITREVEVVDCAEESPAVIANEISVTAG